MTTFDRDRVSLVCFDIDGTLSDTDDQYLRRIVPWMKLLAPVIQRDPERLARWLIYRLESPGSLFLEFLDRLHLDYTANRISEFFDQVLTTRKPPHYSLIPGVDEMLSQLRSKYPMAVVTARGRRKTFAFLEHFQLTGYFGQIITGQTCPRTKPHPDPILWAAKQAGISPEDCLIVGDTTADIRSGKRAGAQTAGVLCGFGQEDELRQAGADLILSNTADLVKELL